MKYLLPLFLTSTLFSNSLYLSSHIGYADKGSLDDTLSVQKISYDKTIEGDFALGYKINAIRVEAEVAHLHRSIDALVEGDIRVQAEGEILQNSYLFNTYYDATNHSKIITSIGAGIGVSSVTLNNYQLLQNPKTTVSTDLIPTAQASFAIGYKSTENLVTEIKYRYTSTLPFELEQEKLEALSAHLFLVGIRYHF